MISQLKRFAFNQARFVFYAQYTIERMMIQTNMSFDECFNTLKKTENGKKYLSNVSLQEMKQEEKNPGSFMNANTDLGFYCNDEYGSYVEDFKEL